MPGPTANSKDLLHSFLEDSAPSRRDHPAVVEPGRGEVTYAELTRLSGRLHAWLHGSGVRPGDRVGIYLRKSIEAVAAIFGILKAGAAYVPLDAGVPVSRNAFILNDCSVKAVIISKSFEQELRAAACWSGPAPALLVMDETADAVFAEGMVDPGKFPPPPVAAPPAPDDLALLLYTSGSTGKPKGVELSHRNQASFIHWCSSVFAPAPGDRFSSHAPFHFDLSILDIFLAFKHGATLVLIDEETAKSPLRLAPFIAEQRITVWYSAPSILCLLAQFGKMETCDYSALRLVLFAGEPFPIKHLRALKNLLPGPEYYNLYGLTETNVCTFFKIPRQIPVEQTRPFPIGITCSHYRSMVADEEGRQLPVGREGELCVNGPAVTHGYWNLPGRTADAFLDGDSGMRWYKTGDLVVVDSEGNHTYVGRKDRMTKKRGYRIELGEIETCLYRHPAVKEAAVIALPDEESGARIKAFLNCHAGQRPSLVALKGFCADNLPRYMIPDQFSYHDSLPKTSTGKMDYQKLKSSDFPG